MQTALVSDRIVIITFGWKLRPLTVTAVELPVYVPTAILGKIPVAIDAAVIVWLAIIESVSEPDATALAISATAATQFCQFAEPSKYLISAESDKTQSLPASPVVRFVVPSGRFVGGDTAATR